MELLKAKMMKRKVQLVLREAKEVLLRPPNFVLMNPGDIYEARVFVENG